MRHAMDLTGRTFGEWTVLGRVPYRPGDNGTYWQCRCSCGRERALRGDRLRDGHTSRCIECVRAEQNLAGRTFGEWTVLKVSHKSGDGRTYWQCRCSCGVEMAVKGYRLRSGQSTRCTQCILAQRLLPSSEPGGGTTVFGRPMGPTPSGLQPAHTRFLEALREAKGTMPMRVIAEKCNRTQRVIGGCFSGRTLPRLDLLKSIVEVMGADWSALEPLWVAALTEAHSGPRQSDLTGEVGLLRAELAVHQQRIEQLERSIATLLHDKEGHAMSTKTAYLLIHRLPGGEIKHYPTPLNSFLHATRAAGLILDNSDLAGSAAARRFTEELSKQPLGAIRTHRSGHGFRVLRADYTADGHAIVPGLRVINTDMWWGTVDPNQFMAHGLLNPGGELFEGWYTIRREDDGYRKDYNGERLALRKPS